MKFYRCPVCGKIVAMVEERQVPTMCCGRPMEEIVPNTQDGAHEKHIPVWKVEENVLHVVVVKLNIQWLIITIFNGLLFKQIKAIKEKC